MRYQNTSFYVFPFFFFFEHLLCINTVGSSWELEIKQLTMLCFKRLTLVKAFTHELQILSFTYICSVCVRSHTWVCASPCIQPIIILLNIICSHLYLTTSLLKAFKVSCQITAVVSNWFLHFTPLSVSQSDESFQNPDLLWPILLKTFQLFLSTLSIKTKHLIGSAESSPYSLSSFMLCPVPYCSIFQPH